MKVRLAGNIQSDSIVDGSGIRTVVWFQGCKHHCKECHNPETWNLNGGFEVDLEDIKEQIKNLKYLQTKGAAGFSVAFSFSFLF